MTRLIHGFKTTSKRNKPSIYTIWADMKARCYGKTSTSYKWYGAKGITVCDEWRSSFSAFYRDMGDRPKGLTLDRINPKGPYSKDNCRWSTPKQQQRNRTSTKLTLEQVNVIRAEIRAGNTTKTDIAISHGVSRTLIRKIAENKVWQ